MCACAHTYMYYMYVCQHACVLVFYKQQTANRKLYSEFDNHTTEDLLLLLIVHRGLGLQVTTAAAVL
jgi:hypothetical protein